MSCRISLFSLALIATIASTVLASAQVTSSLTAANQIQTGTSPVAYVYVSSMPSSGKFEINGYAAASNGALTAISRSAGKLYVFTVTPTSYSQAPGSPHSITNLQNIIVLPKT